ncbi:hypothetical protein NL676_020317 [Syzygium grande]|nr:hypothetical protein NL676_020317 [Syzygium grande]
MMVASVGMNTAWGEMMSSVSRDLDEETPHQARLNKLTSFIGKVGLLLAVLVLLVLMIRYFTGHTQDEAGRREFTSDKTKSGDVMDAVVHIVAAAVTIVVVAIPEGLPLAVTLTLAFSMKRMMGDKAMVRKLSACETMGSATTICTVKTGTLTLNEMRVTELRMGKGNVSVDASREIAASILEVLLQGIRMNTTDYYSQSGTVNVMTDEARELLAVVEATVGDYGLWDTKIRLKSTGIAAGMLGIDWELRSSDELGDEREHFVRYLLGVTSLLR